MILKGQLHVEAPIYRGNARKTLFTRDGDGKHRLVSLAGEITGTAQSLMDAFIGQSRNGKNIGLLNQLWQRLYGASMPNGLITKVDCKLQKGSYQRDNFFDLRMGIKLDEDRWAAESNANYKMETILRNSVFDFTMSVNESALSNKETQAQLYYLLQELIAGRFLLGAGKSKGLGRVRLEMKIPFSPETEPGIFSQTNHLRIDMAFNAENPMLVGWNWGRIDPLTASFADIEAKLLIEAMKTIPGFIRKRMAMTLGGAILNPDDWKQKFGELLPRLIAVWLMKRSSREIEFWTLPSTAIAKLGKGKHGLAKKVLNQIKPFADQPYTDKAKASVDFKAALGKKANMAKRVVSAMELQKENRQELDSAGWERLAKMMGLDNNLSPALNEALKDEDALTQIVAQECQKILPKLYQQVDQQIKLLQSDGWVDDEIKNRVEHLNIKKMIRDGKILEYDWGDPKMVPEGVNPAIWREFVNDHSRVRFNHMLNKTNLSKSITNDNNQIEFLKSYRDRTRQELAQPHHIDFRLGGASKREKSRKYGKPYDTVFMRMLTWKASSQDQEQGSWEAYIPGSTIKGAFRKRASQLLKTLQGESRQTDDLLTRLFGAQGRRGRIFFSDAYLADPDNPDQNWCSVDGIKMDPKTGRPIETAKRDYLYAYGKELAFKARIDIQDIQPDDLPAITLLRHLIRDFRNGDIPLGGQKTSGFGWVEVDIARLEWLAAPNSAVGAKLFGNQTVKQNGVWHQLELEGAEAAAILEPTEALAGGDAQAQAPLYNNPPQARGGFISHRAFGGLSGMLHIDAEVLTPLNIQESGEPSYTQMFDDGPVNGHDFFSIAPPEAKRRGSERIYALPGRSLKGMVRHIYSIASNSDDESVDISRLNPCDSLFGWVGTGPNQALMGRLVFNMAKFDAPQLAWFKAPFPYGYWQYGGGQWQEKKGANTNRRMIDKRWRVFPHTPLAPIVKQTDSFDPDTVQARYFRAMMPGAKARFTVRFWNLLEEELQRLVWCLALEPQMAHKLGNNRYLGFGSIRLNIRSESYLTDWNKRYAAQADSKWRLPFEIKQWRNVKIVAHLQKLQSALNANDL